MQVSLDFTAQAVAALEGGDHGGDGEGQQEKPDDDGDLRTFLQHFDEIPPPKMHHVEVAVEGEGDEEGDAGSSVEKQHEEHRLAHPFMGTASLAMVVMIGFGRKTGHQQEVSDHNVEEEDTFVLPELVPEEEVIDRTVQSLFYSKSKQNRAQSLTCSYILS